MKNEFADLAKSIDIQKELKERGIYHWPIDRLEEWRDRCPEGPLKKALSDIVEIKKNTRSVSYNAPLQDDLFSGIDSGCTNA